MSRYRQRRQVSLVAVDRRIFNITGVMNISRWITVELYKQIISAVEREYGIRLQAIPSTRWSRIPDELRTALTEGANAA